MNVRNRIYNEWARRLKVLFGCAFLVVFVCGLTGCATVEESQKEDMKGISIIGSAGSPEEHLHISNYGYFLFNVVPIFCGNTALGTTSGMSLDRVSWFRDEVTLEATQNILIDEVNMRQCQVTDIQALTKSTCFFSVVPYIGNTLGILWYREVQMSAMLVRAPRSPEPTSEMKVEP